MVKPRKRKRGERLPEGKAKEEILRCILTSQKPTTTDIKRYMRQLPINIKNPKTIVQHLNALKSIGVVTPKIEKKGLPATWSIPVNIEAIHKITEFCPCLVPDIQKRPDIIKATGLEELFLVQTSIFSKKDDETVWTTEETKELFLKKLKQSGPEVSYKTIGEKFKEYKIRIFDEDLRPIRERLVSILRLSPTFFKRVCSPDFQQHFEEFVRRYKHYENPYEPEITEREVFYLEKYAKMCFEYDFLFSNISITPEVEGYLAKHEWDMPEEEREVYLNK